MRKQLPVSQVGLAIRRAVKEQPGIHFRGLGRAAHVTSAGQLRHHLDRLERQGLIVEIEDGRYKRFFVAGDQDPKLRAEMARFSRAVPRRIAKLLLVNPMNRTELRRSLGCADSTLGYHLTRMVQLGDLSRVRGPSSCLYSLTSEETVRKMLTIQGALSDPGLEPESLLTEGLGLGVAADRDPLPAPGPDPTPAPIPVPGRAPEPSPGDDEDDGEVPRPSRPDPIHDADLPFPTLDDATTGPAPEPFALQDASPAPQDGATAGPQGHSQADGDARRDAERGTP